MPRIARVAPGGQVYHVLNRANGKRRIFGKPGDYLAFLRVLALAHERWPVRLLGWCVMPTHWHVVAWPRESGELSRFFGYLGLTHAARWQAAHGEVGTGHVYQARFKNFMVERDEHVRRVLRYVERNAVRAGIAGRAEEWAWGSLHVRSGAGGEAVAQEKGRVPLLPEALRGRLAGMLTEGPAEWGCGGAARGGIGGWVREVNRAQTGAEEEAVRVSIARGRPLGSEGWVAAMAARHGLGSTMRGRGRPRREAEGEGAKGGE